MTKMAATDYCMYDILSQAVVGHAKSVYHLSEPVCCNIVIGKSRPTDSDVCVILGQSLHLDTDMSSSRSDSSVIDHSLLPFVVC